MATKEVGTLAATDLPVTAGKAKSAGWRVLVGEKVSFVISLGLLLVLAYGSFELWWGVWNAVFAGKVFPGVSPLLALGSLFPFFRGYEAYLLAKDRLNPVTVRILFGLMAFVMLCNMLPNVLCMGWAAGLQITGATPWTAFDSWVMAVGGVAGLLVIATWRKEAWKNKKSRFFWVVSWRTIPIAALVVPPLFMPGVLTMPELSARGLTVIALMVVGFILLQLLIRASQSTSPRPFKESYQAMKWLLWAEVANFSASLVLWLVLALH